MTGPTQSEHSDSHPSRRVEEVKRYFAAKAERYDLVDGQHYWAFSDEILWGLLREYAIDRLAQEPVVSLLDAGAGTARWSMRVLQQLPRSTANLVDISPDMLAVAERKLIAAGIADRVRVHQHDLQTGLPHGLPAFNLTICFHNVLSFVSDPPQVVEALVKATAKGGTVVLVVPNHYHACYFSIAQRRLAEMERVRTQGRVKFTDEVPEMQVFTPENLRAVLRHAGACDVTVLGFPVSVYPEMQETQIEGSGAVAQNLFTDPGTRRMLLELESELCCRPEAAARGNNLFVVARV